LFLNITLDFVANPEPICGIDDVDEGRGARIPFTGILVVVFTVVVWDCCGCGMNE